MGNCCSTESTSTVPRPSVPRAKVDNGSTPKDTPVAADVPREVTPETPGEDALSTHSSPTEAPDTTYSVQIGDYNLRYSFYSKRGFYPEARKKANQDSYYCETHFAGDEEKAFFAVFDGHGQYGDVCSQFAAENLPEYLASHLESNTSLIPALTQAHLETNTSMHDAGFDDTMSGTTSISVLFVGNEIHIANVGDSRAIIAQENLKASDPDEQGKLIAKPLSIDQTPFRRDERQRVRKCGARILTVDQLEGLEPIHDNWGLSLGEEIDENGDPPRIWHPYGQYPGTAFSRSIGDYVSEELGVVAEPEILCKTLSPHDRFIVIASDGVFEFLTSQDVVDFVSKYEDPSDACLALAEEAYSRWLQFEPRTDDITVICIYLDGLQANLKRPSGGGRGSIYVGGEVLDMQSMQRPVRGHGGREYGRRNTIVSADAIRLSLTEGLFDEDDPSLVQDLPTDLGEKDEDTMRWIKESIQDNFLFNKLSDDKIHEVIALLKMEDVPKGSVVLRQGAPSSTFYLVESGKLEMRQLSQEKSVPSAESVDPEQFGDLLETLEVEEGKHPTFGEMGLVYAKPHDSTVVATEDSVVWALDRTGFRSVLMRGRPMRDVVHRLRKISLLRPLTIAQTNLVAEIMEPASFEAGAVVLQEGMTEPGFFLITKGKVELSSSHEGSETTLLQDFDYFGELALVRRRSISQRTIRALEDTECLFISRQTLEHSVGRLSTILEKDKNRRVRKDRLAESRQNAPPNGFVKFESEEESVSVPTALDDLEVVGTLSSDPTNTVRLVRVKNGSSPKLMTLRSASKQAIVDSSLEKHVIGERDIYISLYDKNALVPHVAGLAVSDSDLHLLYDTPVVGSLESFLNEERHTETFVRFYAAQVVLALEFLHSEGIVSRTLDPTNLMIDRSGNICMLNLRLSKYVGRGRTYTVCGTPEYMAPEQITGEGHNIAADYWALGVLIYELLCGHTPFSPDKEEDIEMLNRITSFDPEEMHWPENTSKELQDIVKKLLKPNFLERFGFRNTKANSSQGVCQAIKRHPFFAGTSWEATMRGKFAAPLEAEAAALFKDITSEEQSNQDLDIGPPYTDDSAWLNGF